MNEHNQSRESIEDLMMAQSIALSQIVECCNIPLDTKLIIKREGEPPVTTTLQWLLNAGRFSSTLIQMERKHAKENSHGRN